MVELITTPGGPDSNSYVSLAEAEVFFSKRLNSDEWDSASEQNKLKALIMATDILDTLNFAGSKYNQGRVGSSSYQNLQWPRYPEFNDPYMLGIPHLMSFTSRAHQTWLNEEGEPIIPIQLKCAVCEEAYFLIRSIKGIDKREHIRAQGLDNISYPSVSEQYAQRQPICAAAMRWLSKIEALRDGQLYVRS